MLLPGIASRGSFKRQIILTFVVGFFALATAFAFYLVKSERASLYRDSATATTGLAQSLAVSSHSWVLANDVVGLQEVVQSFRDYPELRYAMVLSPTGRVMAHSDAAKVGQFLTDEQSLALVKAAPAKRVMRDDESVIDVAVPIEMGNRHVGWARIGLGREGVAANLRKMIWNVTFYVMLATALSLLAAVLVVNRLGRRIASLVAVAKEVQTGNFATRVAHMPGNEDEITKLANGLNLMLDALGRNEERLRAASLYTRSLIEASLDPLVTISTEGKITDVNKATEAATGRSRSELIGTDFSECFADPEKAREGYRQAFLKGYVTDYPLVLRHRDGRLTNMLYNASVYQNEQGEVLGVFAAARDITERKHAEEALFEAQQIFRTLVENSPDIITRYDRDCRRTYVNPTYLKVAQIPQQELLGSAPAQRSPLPASSADVLQKLLRSVLDSGTVKAADVVWPMADNIDHWFNIFAFPEFDREGKVVSVMTMSRDITERKLAEIERQANLHFFESMDKINRAMQGAKDLEGMLSDVLDAVLEIFDCDRVGLVYPCDPKSPTWQIMMERAKPGYSTEPRRGPLPMTDIRAESLQMLLDTNGPVQFTAEDDPAQRRVETFGIRSFMSMAVRPRTGGVWEFGIHQCMHARTWNAQETRLFEEIGRRLADGLNTMLVYRNLLESEKRYRLVFESSPVSIWEEDFSGVKTLLDGLRQQGVTDIRAYFGQHPETIRQCARLAKIVDVNGAALVLHGAESKEALLEGLTDTFTPESFDTFLEELVCLWNGTNEMMRDAVVKTLAGELRYVTVYFSVCPGYENTLGKVIVSLVDITERKRAEEQIRQSETKYRTLIQNIQAAVVVHGADTRILVSNSMAQEILGLSEDQLSGKTAIDPAWHFFREDGKAAPLDEYPVNRVLKMRQPLRNLVLGVHRPGRENDVWALVNADPVFGKDGEIAQVIVTFFDITERKRMEADLMESEERFRGMFEKHHAVMLLIEPETGQILNANTAAADYYGYSVEKLKSMSINEINMMPWEQVTLERGKAASEERSYFVFPHRLASGEVRTVEVHSSPIVIHGKIILFSITHDITERKQAEENLMRMNERFSLASRAARLGVWDWDIQKNELLWDDGMYALYGVTRADFAGAYEAWLQGIHPDDRAMSDEISKQAQHGEREYDTEFRVVWPDGSVHFLKAYGKFVRDAEGNPLRMTGINFDITERKLTEESLRREQGLLSRIMVTSPVGIAVVSKQGQITYANPQAEKILGLSKEEMSQRSYNAPEWHATAIDGGPFTDEEQPFSLVMATRQPVFDVQHAIVWPDGHRVLLSINGAPIFDAQGEIEAVAFAIEDITERKRAEDELRRKEFGLTEAQRIAHLGSWHMDLATNEVFWSEELYKLYGYDPALPPPLYTESKKLFTPESWERLSTSIGRAAETGIPYELELELVNKEGRKGWMLARGELERDEHGAAVGVRGIVMDITGRKQDELALLRLNRELHAISNCNEALMRAEDEQALLDEICRIICNDAGYRMAWVGYGENDEAKTIRPVAWAGAEDGYLAQARITWADTDRGRGPSGIAIRSGKSACFLDFSTDPAAVPWRDAALQRGYRSSISMPLKDENANTFGILTIYSGEPNAFTPDEIRLLEELAGDMAFGIGVLRTRVERRQAAKALTQSEYMYRTLAENSPDVIVRYDREGRRIYVNPEFERVNHLTAQQVIGKTPVELSTELKPRANIFTEKLMASMASGSPATVDLSWVKEGRMICWFVRVVPEFDASENVVSALTIWSDITERKQAEEEIRSLNRELEQRVTARTADLEAANQELEAFSYSVSHDLRTPLRAIDGFSHILLEDYADKLDEEGKRLLNVVRNNTSRMGQLIDDILKFSRAGRLEISFSEIDMEQLAYSVFIELRPVVAGDKLQLEIEHLPSARGDSAMMRQVFVNLLSNAIKFSRSNDIPKIKVGSFIEGGENIYYVRDNGAGFDMQFVNKLFGVFQRLHSVNEFEGTGIGLAIVKRIITRHGGRVWAEGKVNEGATIYFALPQTSPGVGNT